MTTERRKHARLAIAVDVDISSGDNFYAGRTRDMSEGGLFIETDVDLPVGSVISVQLGLLKRKFSLRAEVTWVLGNDRAVEGVGVRFLDLTDAAAKRIQTFMELRDPMVFDEIEADRSGPPALPQAPNPTRRSH